MLNRVALDREKNYADVLVDFVADVDTGWPDLIEVSARAASIKVRLRLHLDELEVLAVALDTATTGGEGELYFRPIPRNGGPLSSYSAAHLDDIDEVSDGRCAWRPVRHHFGITSFGVNSWTGRNVGDRIINEHAEFEPDQARADETRDDLDEEDASEELYFVHRGRARFELDGEHVDAPAGTFVFVPPSATRTAFAEEPETTIVAVGGVPGQVYEPVGWEVWRPFHQLYESGEYAEVADRARETIEASGCAEPLYNLACCESLAGRTLDALEHLRLSLDATKQFRERLRSLAARDSDLDPIRNEPAFKELVG
jgi:hypothetical protein